MNFRTLMIVSVIGTLMAGYSYGQTTTSGLEKFEIPADKLSTWKVYGFGEAATIMNGQTALREADETKGVMLISPEAYENDVIVSYKVLALTPATVLVALLAASDPGASSDLTIPEDYDGNMGFWTSTKDNYFFAFKTAPHGGKPFITKNPNADQKMALAEECFMIAGVYYDVEVGKKEGRLWLSVDGEKILDANDPDPMKGGHIAFRIRGTAGFAAGCLIKDLVIYHKPD